MRHPIAPSIAALTLLALLACLPISPTTAAEPGADQLIVFVQSTDSAVARHTQETLIPALRQLAADQKAELIVRDVADGAPAAVQITPLIVFQNHLGRSIYQGRSSTLDRVSAFVRTSRHVPQGDGTIEQSGMPVLRQGRTTTWSPVKVAAVTGTPPADYDHDAFVAAAKTAMAKGFTHYTFADDVTLDRADRGFYMDFYPWRAEDGTLFLSLALYSQFHCKEPVWEKKKEPLVGAYTDRAKLFEQAGKLMEDAVRRVMADPTGGDGFDPVPAGTKTVDWEAIGLALPPPPAKADAAATADITLARQWTVAAPRESDPPMVAFRFAPPHDNTSGYAQKASGSLSFADDTLQLSSLSGQFTVDVRSLTMGDPDLDMALGSKTFFHTSKYPTSSFTIQSVELASETEALAFGEFATVLFHGEFSMKGQTIPLTAPMQLEVVLSDELQPELWARGTFSLNIQPFGLDAGFQTGPEASRFTVIYDLNFRLTAKAE